MQYILIFLICLLKLSFALIFLKCDEKNRATHCFFSNLTNRPLIRRQRITFCFKQEPTFDYVDIAIVQDFISYNKEYDWTYYSGRFAQNQSNKVAIEVERENSWRPSLSIQIKVYINDRIENMRRLNSSFIKELILAVEGHWEGNREFTTNANNTYSTNCMDEIMAIYPNSGVTNNDTDKFYNFSTTFFDPVNGGKEFGTYYIIIILGILLPTALAIFSIVWILCHRKKKESNDTNEEVYRTDDTKTKKKGDSKEVPSYVNVLFQADESKEREPIGEIADVSYIEVDFGDADHVKIIKNFETADEEILQKSPEGLYATVVTQGTPNSKKKLSLENAQERVSKENVTQVSYENVDQVSYESVDQVSYQNVDQSAYENADTM